MSKYPWLRLYTEFASDPKIQILAFEDQRHFVMLLCLKGNGTLDADAPTDAYRERLIAKALGLDPTSSLEAKRRLIEGGLIASDWQPLKWESRQFQSDSSTSRVQKFREKSKGNVSETFQKRSSNGDVTVQSRVEESRSDQSRGDKKKISAPSEPHSVPENVRAVFDHWRSTWNHPTSALDAKRTAIIQKALKGYTAATLCDSISGYRNSPHHTGVNDRNTVYDGLHLLLRDNDHIDAGIRFFTSPPPMRSEKSTQNLRAIEDWRPPGFDYDAERLPEISGGDGGAGRGIHANPQQGNAVPLLGRAKGSAN